MAGLASARPGLGHQAAGENADGHEGYMGLLRCPRCCKTEARAGRGMGAPPLPSCCCRSAFFHAAAVLPEHVTRTGSCQRHACCPSQDLAVVVLLMLIPLLAPTDSGAPAGLATISKALGIAALKARRCRLP